MNLFLLDLHIHPEAGKKKEENVVHNDLSNR